MWTTGADRSVFGFEGKLLKPWKLLLLLVAAIIAAALLGSGATPAHAAFKAKPPTPKIYKPTKNYPCSGIPSNGQYVWDCHIKRARSAYLYIHQGSGSRVTYRVTCDGGRLYMGTVEPKSDRVMKVPLNRVATVAINRGRRCHLVVTTTILRYREASPIMASAPNWNYR